MSEKSYIHCKWCGCLTEQMHGRQKYCPECAERKKRKISLDVQMIKCEECGGYVPYRPHRKYCETCAANRKHRQDAKSQKALVAQRKKTEPELRPTIKTPRRTGELFELSGKSLAEVSLEARTLGMTYGKYTSACALGTIEAVLNAQGISRDKAQHMVAAAKKARRAMQKKLKKTQSL